MVTYQVIDSKALSHHYVQRWTAIARSFSELSSPYFRPEFVQCVMAVRQDVRVLVIREGDEVVGFFPFHRGIAGIARPLGLGLSDFHGVIASPHMKWDATEMMAACGVRRFCFDHFVLGQSGFLPWISDWQPSPQIRLEQGWEGYQQQMDAKARKQYKESQRKLAKLEQDYGAVRFIEHTDSPEVLQAVFEWKSQQCRQTGVTDFFSYTWIRALMRRLLAVQQPEFQGVLSAIYAGQQLVAAHFGMRTNRVWHYWFPVYDHNYSEYSPGLILLYEIIRAAATQAYNHIDLGKGMSVYKERVMNAQVPVGSGCVVRGGIVNQLILASNRLERLGAGTPFQTITQLPVKISRHIARDNRFK